MLRRHIVRLLSLSTAFALSLYTLFVLIILLVAGTVYSPLWDFLRVSHIYEILTTIVLLEVLFLQLSAAQERVARGSIVIDAKEDALIDRIQSSAFAKRPISVDIFSSGLWSRHKLIAKFIATGIDVRVIIPSKEGSTDVEDVQLAEKVIENIRRNDAGRASRFFKIKQSTSAASLRSILIRRERLDDSELVVSWYTYNSQNKVIGHENPAIYMSGVSRQNLPVLSFVNSIFNELWEAGRDA